MVRKIKEPKSFAADVVLQSLRNKDCILGLTKLLRERFDPLSKLRLLRGLETYHDFTSDDLLALNKRTLISVISSSIFGLLFTPYVAENSDQDREVVLTIICSSDIKCTIQSNTS